MLNRYYYFRFRFQKAEEEKRTLNSILRLAIQQKLNLTQRIEALEVELFTTNPGSVRLPTDAAPVSLHSAPKATKTDSVPVNVIGGNYGSLVHAYWLIIFDLVDGHQPYGVCTEQKPKQIYDRFVEPESVRSMCQQTSLFCSSLHVVSLTALPGVIGFEICTKAFFLVF